MPQTLSLFLIDGVVTDAATGEALLPLHELGRVAYYRPDTLPAGFTPELMVTRHYAQRDYPFIFTDGVQASYVEVDTETGLVKLLKHWAVEDCGRVINPMLVDEQIRGAIVQGIGGALFEECLYDNAGPRVRQFQAKNPRPTQLNQRLGGEFIKLLWWHVLA